MIFLDRIKARYLDFGIFLFTILFSTVPNLELALAAPTNISVTLQNGIRTLINTIMTISTPIAVLMISFFLLGWLISADDKDKVKYRKLAINTGVAWVVLMLIGPILNFVMSTFGFTKGGTIPDILG